MLRLLAFSLLSFTLLASPASAQTAPARKAAKPAPRMVPNTSPAARAADPLRGTNTGGKGENGYAAPGEPITSPNTSGKNTPPYDGPAAGHGQAKKRTTLGSPN